VSVFETDANAKAVSVVIAVAVEMSALPAAPDQRRPSSHTIAAETPGIPELLSSALRRVSSRAASAGVTCVGSAAGEAGVGAAAVGPGVGVVGVEVGVVAAVAGASVAGVARDGATAGETNGPVGPTDRPVVAMATGCMVALGETAAGPPARPPETTLPTRTAASAIPATRPATAAGRVQVRRASGAPEGPSSRSGGWFGMMVRRYAPWSVTAAAEPDRSPPATSV